MADGHRFEKKIEKSPYLSQRFDQWLRTVVWQSALTLWTALIALKIKLLRIHDGRPPPFWKTVKSP